MKKLPDVREMLETDIEAAFRGDPAATGWDEVVVAYPFIEAVAIQRVAHLFYREGLPLVPRIMTEWAHSRTAIDISPGTEIGSHFFIDHGTGVVIGETSKIGSHVKLYQGVALIADLFQQVNHCTDKSVIRRSKIMLRSTPGVRSWVEIPWSAPEAQSERTFF